MGKLNSRLIGLILLVVWCSMVCAANSNPQYRRVFISQEDAGEIVAFILIVIISEIGKKLDKNYVCPVYCEVDHKHYYWGHYEKNYEQENNIQAATKLYRTTGTASKE